MRALADRFLALWGAVFVCHQGVASAADLNWVLQAWGTPSPVAEATPRKGCPDLPGAAPVYYAESTEPPGAGAELIIPAVLKPGHAYEFSFSVMAPKGQPSLDVFFRKDSPFYDTGAIRTVQASERWQRVTLRGGYDGPGTGSVRLDLRALGTAVCVAHPQLTEIRSQDVGSDGLVRPVSSHFFGVHLNRLGSHTRWPDFEPDIVRLWASGTEWHQMQPTSDRIDWRRNPHAQRLEFLSKFVISRGRRAELIMTLALTPHWAGRKSAAAACTSSPFGAGTCMPPEDLNTWREFVRTLVSRYKDRILVWEIWNEADVPMHWSGSVQDLVALTRAASEEIRKQQPNAVVIGPNVTGIGLRMLHNFLMAGGGQYVDAVSVHTYLSRAPGQSGTAVRNLREILKNLGMADKPIWNTEANTSCGTTGPQDQVLSRSPCDLSAPEAIAQTYLMQAALGVQNISFYTWEGTGNQFGNSSLVQPDYETPTAEGRTVRELVELMRDASIREVMAVTPGVEMVEITRARQVCRAFWSFTGRTVPINEPDMRTGWSKSTTWRAESPSLLDEPGKFRAGNWPSVVCKTLAKS
jgi:Glycosyl hydrolases family 39